MCSAQVVALLSLILFFPLRLQRKALLTYLYMYVEEKSSAEGNIFPFCSYMFFIRYDNNNNEKKVAHQRFA